MRIHHAYIGIGLAASGVLIMFNPHAFVRTLQVELYYLMGIAHSIILIGIPMFFHDLYVEIKKWREQRKIEMNKHLKTIQETINKLSEELRMYSKHKK